MHLCYPYRAGPRFRLIGSAETSAIPSPGALVRVGASYFGKPSSPTAAHVKGGNNVSRNTLDYFVSRSRRRMAGRANRAKGPDFGLVADILVGIVGAFIGSWMLPRLGIHLGSGIVPAIIGATVGALVLLLILRSPLPTRPLVVAG